MNKAVYTYILNPEGKRFSTVDAVNTYLTELILEKETQETEAQLDTREEMNLMTKERRAGVARRKKNMSDKNPLRNMLKKTLKKNYFKRKSLSKKKLKKRH